jgi:hypothetical protein
LIYEQSDFEIPLELHTPEKGAEVMRSFIETLRKAYGESLSEEVKRRLRRIEGEIAAIQKQALHHWIKTPQGSGA